MRLSELIKNLPDKRVIGNADIPIAGIAYDSRRVDKGFIFVAISGQHLDGRSFINDAIGRGASVIVAEEAAADTDVTQVVVPDVRDAMARLSAAFYREPSRNMTLMGVTGTNGKTTITYLIESILSAAGCNVGVIGTVNYRYAGKTFSAPHTTPEAPDLNMILREMVDNGITHCAMEVSSHALAQKRVDGCRFTGAVFTNLTQDHLDYHGTMERYFESKSRLFTDFITGAGGGFSVINIDDPWGRRLSEKLRTLNIGLQGLNKKPEIFSYSINGDSDIKPVKASFSERGIDAILNTSIGRINISSFLLGDYNLQNIMAAVGAGIGLGLNRDVIENGVTSLKRVDGRLERILSKGGFHAVVDYAHTGDALERVLNTLKPLAKGRLITVFGCGGDRDRGKRPVMGEIATRLSDFTIITSDNPRSEEPMEIIKEIETGIKNCNKAIELQLQTLNSELRTAYAVIPDRHDAIRAAINMAAPKDIILVAGKGHEDYQIVGSRRIPFDDTREIKMAIEEREGVRAAG